MKTRLQEKKQYILTIAFTLIALIFIVAYSFLSFYINAVSNLEAMGVSSLKQETERLRGYLVKGMDVLQVTSITVEYMMQQGASAKDIEVFLVEESERYKEEIDINFTGIYGLFDGNYLDGIGWVPDDDYVPKEREWYLKAKAEGGKPTLVSPYLDAQTNTIMISVSQMLYDGESVISLDITMDEMQIITEDIQLDGMGYGFVVDSEGLVIAHYNEEEKGKNYKEGNETQKLLHKLYTEEGTSFRMEISGELCTVFRESIMDEWYVAMIVSNTKLFHEIHIILLRNIVISICVFVLIVFFCTLSFRKIGQSKKLVEESLKKVEKMNNTLVRTLVKTIDAKDRYTNGHSQRVAKYAAEIAKRMGKTKDEQNNIYHAGLLHDLGKIRVPEEVINKPDKLTDEEFEQIKVHPIASYYILKDIYEDPLIALGAKFHHERYDGKGYPNGLLGDSIPEIARIIGVADAYDAMASNRSYRKALPQEVVYSEIKKGKGAQFDPEIADIMLSIIEEDKEYSLKQSESCQKKILMVDNEPVNIQLLEFILKDEPLYSVFSAFGGKEALKILESSKIDLVFLDINIPDIDGFELFQRIREKYAVPVVFMTTDKEIKTIQRIMETGAEDYVTKPILPLVIKEVLRSMLIEGEQEMLQGKDEK